MTDWTRPYAAEYEFWKVDRATWRDRERLTLVGDCTITRDIDDELAESARLTVGDPIAGEQYVRCYLAASQDGAVERTCLGTWLVQTPTVRMDGKAVERELEAYSPLIELRDDMPPIGYTAYAGDDPLDVAAAMCREHASAPVIPAAAGTPLAEPYTVGDNESCLDFVSGLLALAGFRLAVTPYGEITFSPTVSALSLRPAWTYSDGTDSIMEAEVETESDWYGLPNAVEVVLSDEDGSITGSATDDDPASGLSTVRRMRRVAYRCVNPDDLGKGSSQATADAYAARLLGEMSAVEMTASYTHSYCPVSVGDGVRIAYARHRFDIRARVVRQEISCDAVCTVSETARCTRGM